MVKGSSGTMILTMPSEREIVLTRVFDAPRDLVFEAVTKPEHVARWWGPRGTTLPVCEIDLRPGGAYRYVTRGSDGSENPFKGVFHEIAPPDRLVFTQIYDVEPWSDHECVITTTFEEADGRTTLTSTSVFTSVEDRDAMISSGMEPGAAESYDRLAELLQTLS
jgi:uncharacterized protein YndB with AHSA1/START domain